MKKYEKPMVIIEDYSVSEFIANNSCEAKVSFRDGVAGCTHLYKGVIPIFSSQAMGCSNNPGANGDFNGICYHGPNGSNNFFSS